MKHECNSPDKELDGEIEESNKRGKGVIGRILFRDM